MLDLKRMQKRIDGKADAVVGQASDVVEMSVCDDDDVDVGCHAQRCLEPGR